MLEAVNVSKAYDGRPVIRDFSARFVPGSHTCLMGPSGCGKTTLLRLLMGLEAPDSGQIRIPEGTRFSAVFQEDRLCMGIGAVKNIRLVRPDLPAEAVRRELLELLPADSLSQPVSEFSGGMRRRVSLLRALLSSGDFLLFDEPFEGLDEKTRAAAMELVKQKREGRTLLFASHYPEEARALGAEIISLSAG